MEPIQAFGQSTKSFLAGYKKPIFVNELFFLQFL